MNSIEKINSENEKVASYSAATALFTGLVAKRGGDFVSTKQKGREPSRPTARRITSMAQEKAQHANKGIR